MTEQEIAEARERYLAEGMEMPLKYLVHDVGAHRDAALMELRDEHGMEAYGRYWLLMEVIAERRGHRVDVKRPNGWARLARDLELEGPDEARAFVERLLELNLVSRASYARGLVAVNRIDRTAEEAARDYASGKVGALVRWAKRQVKGVE